MERVTIAVPMSIKLICTDIQVYKIFHGGLLAYSQETVCSYLMGESFKKTGKYHEKCSVQISKH